MIHEYLITWVTDSEQGSHGPSWHIVWQLCFPQLRVLSQTLSQRTATAVAHFTVCLVFLHAQDFVVKAWHGGHGPGWQRILQRWGQSWSRCLPHTSPQLCGVMYWRYSGSFVLPKAITDTYFIDHSSHIETQCFTTASLKPESCHMK